MHSLNYIRQLFIDFFVKNHHQYVKSSPLIPENDPSLLFTNAGMVQFKDYFLGNRKPEFDSATSVQKCLRAGGKHNDLENVGYTHRHHTFFEMLGNFSFGDYNKKQAIKLAWDFVTKELSLPPNKLCITVYHTDDEAVLIWQKVSNLPPEQIIRISSNDNFWSMGNTGPCGPCSEIFYDNGENISGGLPGTSQADGNRFVEIWNLVFMEHNRDENGKLTPLPQKGIDTGMGLERIAAVTQGVVDNYDTDLFAQLIQKSQELSGNSSDKVAHKVITDHMRAATFLIAEGVMPSNQGRGYVLRRIIRRAVRFAYRIDYRQPILVDLLPTLQSLMGKQYPELIRTSDNITHTLRVEEENFLHTLEHALDLFNSMTAQVKSGGVFSGESAFKLYDTYGLPLDITIDLLKEKNITVDEAGFEQEMNNQRKMGQEAWQGSGESNIDRLWFSLLEGYGKTDFIRSGSNNNSAQILAIIKENKCLTDITQYQNIGTGDKITLLLNQTSFYAESGGQIGDIGTIRVTDKSLNEIAQIEITDTKKILNALHAHIGILKSGKITSNTCTTNIDSNRRKSLQVAHSATHLLHFTLRNIIGKHVTQKGSLVAEDRIRFDFSHNKPLTTFEIKQIENEVNNLVWQGDEIITDVIGKEEAIEQGAMALFGEKYEDKVRVVTMGESKELCGGTHVHSTHEIGCFVITKESSIASGIRRIEGLTRGKALNFLYNCTKEQKAAMDDYKRKIKELEQLSKQKQNQLYNKIIKNIVPQVEKIKNMELVITIIDDVPADFVRAYIIMLLKQSENKVFLYFSNYEKKYMFFVGVTNNLTNEFTASELIKIAGTVIGVTTNTGSKELAQSNANSDHYQDIILKIKQTLMQ